MPFISIKTSLPEIEDSEGLLKELSKLIAILTGKPEKYVMTLLEKNVPMTFSGNNNHCCYIEIKSIGSLKPATMTAEISKFIEAKTQIKSDRIYINFEDIDAKKWGYNGRTFA
tara:strand:+ start:229 stop:567 length:339 start_codon:yes stop_codon:yes gene_type:complete